MKKSVTLVSVFAMTAALGFASSALAQTPAAYNLIYSAGSAAPNVLYTIHWYPNVASDGPPSVTSIGTFNTNQQFQSLPANGVKFDYIASKIIDAGKQTTPVAFCTWKQPVGQAPTITGYHGTSDADCLKYKPNMDGGNYTFGGTF